MDLIYIAAGMGNMLDSINDLEEKINTRIPFTQKLLFAASGNLDRTLSLLVGSETEVIILEQQARLDVICRSVNIVLKKNGAVLVHARSKIYPSFLPKVVVERIRKKQESIGEILDSERLEVYRSIQALGYNPDDRSFVKIYHIVFRRNIAFNIEEVFLTSLHDRIKLSASI